MERNIRRSQSRVGSYHQRRAAVAKVGSKKEITPTFQSSNEFIDPDTLVAGIKPG
ncbi:hypothetical protein GTPT_2246 [Tatumella ptyseos ATCC 33301]|uniref:Uncharacterized protein n=1 Tax=Tatumella ptyseos ATCC 33301 TaxID=1005995 RepID=A0A085JEP9_9GAMM|nr:hypothetical protein GTPT_2246 [Tatumella ptyseos ATCC 33301]